MKLGSLRYDRRTNVKGDVVHIHSRGVYLWVKKRRHYVPWRYLSAVPGKGVRK